MPKFFDDSDLVETDRDWVQKVLFPSSDHTVIEQAKSPASVEVRELVVTSP